ncbi:hypothetical protein O181_024198 [Austropuccinia psidii MF-1]|uniref:Uncharacterized protein n=1 Tax=Austropuccinia psidii MF-1 TaxID=1389203 RepID=A0A9Q3CKA7_9BASI|nr:hypothetical protein [Austropuccinia psidii MF-1]
MRDLLSVPFTIIILIWENSVKVRLTERFSRKHPVFSVSSIKFYQKMGENKFLPRSKGHTPQDIVEVEDSLGPVKKTVKARNIRLNGKENRQYFSRFKDLEADKDKLLAEDAIPDGDLNLRIFRASRMSEQSHK